MTPARLFCGNRGSAISAKDDDRDEHEGFMARLARTLRSIGHLDCALTAANREREKAFSGEPACRSKQRSRSNASGPRRSTGQNS